MIYIPRGKEPVSLVKYRKLKYAYYDGCDKSDIRKALLENQGYLCAYCMKRINENSMKIEHWYPESKMTDAECLDFRNMLGCCSGHIDGDSGDDDTCDTHKADMEIKINPRDRSHIMQVQYKTSDGTIYSDNLEFNYDICKVLNLNSGSHYLRLNRKSALDAFFSYVEHKKREGTWNSELLKKMLDYYEKKNSDGKLREYSGIVVWYIRRRIFENV